MNINHSVQLDALGDATRRAILARLVKEGPLPVGELARDFPLTRPAISQHLQVLKRANLVTDRVRERVACALAVFKRHAEEGTKKKR